MLKIATTASALLLLASVNSAAQQQCVDLGYKKGTALFLSCYNAAVQQQQDEENRQAENERYESERRQNGWRALQQWGQQLQQQDQANTNALMNQDFGSTTCRRVGAAVRCNSW